MQLIANLLLVFGCGSPAPEGPPPAPEPIAEDAEDAEDAAPPPFTPPPVPEGLSGVDVVGYGLRITMHPPFQVSQVVDFSPVPPKEGEDRLILSWWDVSDANVGKGAGRVGLHNASAVGLVVPEAGQEIIAGRVRRESDKSEAMTYRLGATGSYVRMPASFTEAGGMLTVAPGPADASWALEVDGKRTPLKSKHIVHSADPASGAPFEMTTMPHQPWGPWPASVAP